MFDGLTCFSTKAIATINVDNKNLETVIKGLPPSFTIRVPVPEQARPTFSKMKQEARIIRLFGVDLVTDKSRSESSSAPKRARLFDSDLNHNTDNDQTGDASTSPENAFNSVGISEHGIDERKTHCLLFTKILPEASFLVCLQCLDPGEEDERYLVAFLPRTDRQWAFRYTSTETPAGTMKKCGTLCGDITWGSPAHCLAAHINYITTSSLSPATDHYSAVKVEYQKVYKQSCLECVRFVIKPIVEHNEDDDMHSIFAVYEKVVELERNHLLARCKISGYCLDVEDDPFQLGKSLSEFRSNDPLKRGSEDSFTERESTTPYSCMHIIKRGNFAFRKYRSCIRQSKLYKTPKNGYRETSHDVSGLMFSAEVLRVQEIAITCYRTCGWVAGLPKPMCDFLQELDKVQSHSNLSSQDEPAEQPFVDAITKLGNADRSRYPLW